MREVEELWARVAGVSLPAERSGRRDDGSWSSFLTKPERALKDPSWRLLEDSD